MRTVGVTGGLCTGKSLVTGFFKDLGAAVLDADVVAHTVLDEDGDARRCIIDEFGPGVAGEDGRISRRKLGEIVFADGERLRRLNEIVHPKVKRAIRRWLRRMAAEGENSVAVIDVPLLIEADMLDDFDSVVIVTASRENQVLRCVKRDGLSRGEALARIKTQLPLEEKEKHADYVVRNDSGRGAAKKRVMEIWEQLNRK